MRIVLVGEGAPGTRVLDGLERRGHDIVAVMAEPDRDDVAGRSMWQVATAKGHRTWPVADVRIPETAERVRDADVDLVLNVHSLHVVDASLLETARFGWYNLHPGKLPEYAGLNTVGWAIYQGEASQGVTVHRMAARVDAGAIAYATTFPIGPSDTALAVSARCAREGTRLMLELVDTLEADPMAVPIIAQDLRHRRVYAAAEIPEGGRFTWDRPARRIVDLVRAFDHHPLPPPWGFPRAPLGGRDVGVIGAGLTGETTDSSPGRFRAGPEASVWISCADEWITVDHIEIDGEVTSASAALAA